LLTVVVPLEYSKSPVVYELCPVPPLLAGSVPVVPPSIGRPVALVSVAAEGVPRFGVVSVGEVPNTNDPLPVSSVTAAAKFAELGVARNVATPVPNPDTPVEIGKPVAFVSVAAEGVPRFGVVSVGDVERTTFPLPVDVVTPVPPLATASVPARVIVPVDVTGPPDVVSPVVPPETFTLVTPSATLEETLTKSEPFHAARHFSPAATVIPAVGPPARRTID